MEQAVAMLTAQVQQLQANLADSQHATQRLAHDSAQAIGTLTAQLNAVPPPAPARERAMIDTRMLTKPRQFSGKPEE